MRLEQSNVIKLLISDVEDLDVIAVYIEDLGPCRGKITITCFNDCWSYFWGAMGKGLDISTFFRMASDSYLAGKLQPRLNDTEIDLDQLEHAAKKRIIEQRRAGDIAGSEARELYDISGYLSEIVSEDPTGSSDFMYRIFGDEWWYSAPQKPNHEYVRLCRIIRTIKEALEKQTIQENPVR